MAVELMPHQLTALEKIHNGCVLKGGVGTGKTITALSYYFREILGLSLDGLAAGSDSRIIPIPGGKAKPRKDIYVFTTAKKRNDLDWEKESLPFGISDDRELSETGVQLHVDSWNNIVNYTNIKGAFVVFDEQRLVGSGSWVKAFYKIAKANDWIMLSATPGDTWMDYIPIFVANGWYKNRTEFIRRHVVYSSFSKFPKVDRYVEVAPLIRYRNRVLVEMPFDRHTTRHVENCIMAYDQELYERVWKDRWHVYEDRPLRDISELFSVARKVVNSDDSRLAEVQKLWSKHERVIVFYNFNYELDALRILCGTIGAPFSEWNGKKHEPIPEDNSWIYLVQYTAGAEGWNCIATNAEIFFSQNYSWKINEQAKGRIDRLNTPYKDLYYYMLRSNSPIDQAIHRSLVTKKNFNEKQYIQKSTYGKAA